MRNFVMGFLVCAVLFASGQAFGASTSPVGKTVSSELVVDLNGKEIGTAVVISNKSYLPVREVAGAFGAEIELKKGGVSLTTDTGVDTVAVESQRAVDLEALRNRKETIEKDIPKLQTGIDNLESQITKNEDKLSRAVYDTQKELYQSLIDQDKVLVDRNKKLIPQLEQELADTIQKISELEAQE